MKDKYIPDLIMSVIWKNHENDSHKFISKDKYRKAMKEVAEETGWNFNCSCCTSGKADTETERNEFVKMLSDIDKKYNTK